MLSKFLSLINHEMGLASNSCFGWGDMYFFLYSSSKKWSLFSNNFVFDMRCLIFFSSCSRYFCRFSLSSYLLIFCLVCYSRYRCPLHVAGIGLAGMKGFISESYFCYFSSIIYLTLRYRMVMCSRGLVRLNYLTTTGLNTGFSYFSYLLSLIFFIILSIWSRLFILFALLSSFFFSYHSSSEVVDWALKDFLKVYILASA